MKTTHFIFPLILALAACTTSTFDPGLNTATAAQERREFLSLARWSNELKHQRVNKKQ